MTQPQTTTGIEIIELREAGEDGGSYMGYYAKGHIPAELFARLANEFSGASEDDPNRYVLPKDVRHKWLRIGQMEHERRGFHCFHEAKPGSRGAWRATMAEPPYERFIERTERKKETAP